MENLICPVCGNSNFIIKNILRFFKNDECSFEYFEKVAVCSECGEEIYSDELQHENQKIFEEAYKEANRIISNEEILEILKKYNISKRALPYVLGIGELTITRYLDGYVPTKKISDLLKSVLNDPSSYKYYLELNKNKLTKNVYAKTSNKVNSLLGIFKFDEKLEAYADYIIFHNEETSNLVLNKLLYFCDVFNRVFNNKKAFDTICGAWLHGPVYGQIYYEYKNFGNNAISKDYFDDEIKLSNEEIKLIDKVIEYFGIYSGKVLSFFTHEEGPWKETVNNGSNFIEDTKINEYANNIKMEYSLNKYRDIKRYSEYLFEKYKNIFMKQ